VFHAGLHGIDKPATDALGYMPGFAASLSDKQVADIAAWRCCWPSMG
jgi:nicotinate dehydrogenase subunit B